MATTMPTVNAEVSAPPDWGIELGKKGWELEGIDLKDEATMNDIYEDLGIQGDSKDHRKLRNWLRSYIVKKQQARGKKSFRFGLCIIKCFRFGCWFIVEFIPVVLC